MQKRTRTTQGYALLISVLILGGITLSASVGVAQRTRESLWGGYDAQQGKELQVLSHACADLGMYSLTTELGYDGNESKALLNATCTILPIVSVGADLYEMPVTVTRDGFAYRARVLVELATSTTYIREWSYLNTH